MDETKQDLLMEVIEDRLSKSLNGAEDEKKEAFKEAMAAVDRGNERQKTNDAYSENVSRNELEQSKFEFDQRKFELERERFDFDKEKFELESQKLTLENEKFEFEKEKNATEAETKKTDRKFNIIIKAAEITAPIVVLVVKFLFDRKNMKDVANFEKDYTWTTTPGRVFSKNIFNNK